LTIDAASTLANNTFNTPCDLNLQGAGLGLWNAILVDSSFSPLNVLMRGTGTWVLGGANTYSGTTTVSSGTLLVNGQIGAGNVSVLTGGTLGGNGTLGGAVTVAAGGAIAPGNGLGTFTINNTLALAPGSFTSVTIDKTTAASSQVAGLSSLTYGGTLVVTNLAGTLTTSDAFKLFSSTAYAGTFAAITPAVPGPGLAWNTNTLATDGTLRIVVGIANNPTKLSASVVAGNNLQIFWPYDHLGWTLQVQTNALNVGIRTNWVNVAGSSTTNSVTVPIGARNACVFYRLIN
jgi:autotransporter-associated beta strand protein